tara:strand:+ start:80 stop:790 length:711 start_codon:yes stop_codon:yes gene_type:complete
MNIEHLEKYTLFNQDPIYEFKNPHHSLIKRDLIEFIYNDWENEQHRVHRYSDDTFVAKDPINGKVVHPVVKNNIKECNFDFFERTHDVPLIANLFDFIHKCMYNVQINLNREFCETHRFNTKYAAWYHITNNHGYHDFHMHAGTLSAFYVVQGDPNHAETKNGTFMFRDFDEPKRTDDPFCNYKLDNFDRHHIPIQNEGSLCIFPGWVNHQALPYNGKEDRIIFAINTHISDVIDR